MKKILLFIYALSGVTLTPVFAQLPPVAQALYDEIWTKDSLKVKFALNNGGQVFATPDGNSFYVKWFPTGSTPSATPLIVTLHGSEGNAFAELYDWFSQALSHGCGIVALQWYRGDSSFPPNDYLNDASIYTGIDSALTEFGYPSGKAFLHGFSRGSARSYAVIFKDSHGGKNYFCTTLANAGGADPGYPLYAQIDSGAYGSNVFLGKHWTLFCGGLDTIATCAIMTNTQAWLQAQGATVDIFIQDPNLGHGGFHSTPAYMDSILDNYILCFNNGVPVSENLHQTNINISPNPFHETTTLEITNFNNKNCKLRIYDVLGNETKKYEIQKNKTEIRKDDLRSGIYFYFVTEGRQLISSGKIIIE